MAPSFAYQYFHTSNGDPYATCKLCSTVVKCQLIGSYRASTSMVKHLRHKHPHEINKAQPSFVDRERELKDFFDLHGGDNETLCSSELSQNETPKFGESNVNNSDVSDMQDDILVYIELLMRDIKDLKARLSHLETNPSKLPDTEILEQKDDITYKPNIITVKGFTFEDYPH